MKLNTIHKRAGRAISMSGKKCAKCGSIRSLERHHEDYTKPLDVVILCHQCHMRLHYQLPKRACRMCGKMFRPSRTRRNMLCGNPTCLIELGKASAQKRWGLLNKESQCAYCGMTFIRKRPRQKTCGRSCGNKLAWEQKRAVPTD